MERTIGGLAELHAYLVAHFPLDKPPALITLKRWSAEGRLDSCKIAGTTRRSIDLPKAAKLVMGSDPNSDQAELPKTAASAECPKTSNLDPATDRIQAEALTPITTRLDELTQTVERLLHAVNNLDAVRKALLLKYDESNSRLLQLVNLTRGRQASVPEDSGDILTMARIAKRLQRIEEHLEALRGGT